MFLLKSEKNIKCVFSNTDCNHLRYYLGTPLRVVNRCCSGFPVSGGI